MFQSIVSCAGRRNVPGLEVRWLSTLSCCDGNGSIKVWWLGAVVLRFLPWLSFVAFWRLMGRVWSTWEFAEFVTE